MSRHTEYVVWEDAVGQWNAATYQTHATGSHEDEAWDEIWGYEYNYDRLSWVSENHSSLEEARKAVSRMNGNPGHGGNVYQFSTEPDMVEQLNLLVKFLKDPAFEKSYTDSKNREKHTARQAELVENLKKNNGYVGLNVYASFAHDIDSAMTGCGLFSGVSGYVAKDAEGWLTVSGRKLFNTETSEVEELLYSIKESSLPNFRYR